MRVVLDTNLVLSALVFGRRLVWLRQAMRDERVTPVICVETLAELTRALAYPKFKLSLAIQLALLAEYVPHAEEVVLPDPPPTVPECRDRGDLMFLQLAMAAGADALVSGDGDVAALAGTSPVPIITAAALRLRVEER